jgi:hypothetical protein
VLFSPCCLPLIPPSRVTRTPPPARVLQALFDHIPVGVGSQGIIPTTAKDLEAALEMGMDWSLRWGTCLSVAIFLSWVAFSWVVV